MYPVLSAERERQFKTHGQDKVAQMITEGREYLTFMALMYKRQMVNCEFNLRMHPRPMHEMLLSKGVYLNVGGVQIEAFPCSDKRFLFYMEACPCSDRSVSLFSQKRFLV